MCSSDLVAPAVGTAAWSSPSSSPPVCGLGARNRWSTTATSAVIEGGPRVVALGGGHGLAVTLRAVREYAGEITAIVTVADDGGSSGRLRRAFDVPAPGDLRRCLVALASEAAPWPEAFEHRFEAGELEGHALGNLILVGLAETLGSLTEALAVTEIGRAHV